MPHERMPLAYYSYLYDDKKHPTMNWQETAVAAIGIIAAAIAIRAIVRGIKTRRYSSCASCSDTACPLRDIKERRGDCTRRTK